jgi:hypothetical protein
MKKILCAIVFASLCCAVFAQKETDFQAVSTANGKIIITGYTGTDKSVSVPKKIMGADVTTIGPGAFANQQLTKIKLPDTIGGVSKQAFMNNSLTEVIIPKNVFFVEQEAFANNKITTVTINKDGITLDPRTFANNPITKIVIGKNASFDKTTFTPDFYQAYRANTLQAGTYTFANGKWTYKK